MKHCGYIKNTVGVFRFGGMTSNKVCLALNRGSSVWITLVVTETSSLFENNKYAQWRGGIVIIIMNYTICNISSQVR